MKIQPITETAFNQARLTMDAQRIELLFYREEQIPALQAQIRDMEKTKATLDENVGSLRLNNTELQDQIKCLEKEKAYLETSRSEVAEELYQLKSLRGSITTEAD